MSRREVEASRFVAAEPERVYDVFLAAPLSSIFESRYGAFPPIIGVREAVGEWGDLGASRVIDLSDGGSTRETITRVERPLELAYELDEIRAISDDSGLGLIMGHENCRRSGIDQDAPEVSAEAFAKLTIE